MNILQEKFQQTGLKQNFVAKKLDVTEKTIGRWINMEGIEFSVKFVEFLHMCNICPFEFLNVYHNTFKYKCPKDNCEDCNTK